MSAEEESYQYMNKHTFFNKRITLIYFEHLKK